MKFLIVVDMQHDFVRGALGSSMAEAIVPHVVKKAAQYDGTVIFTRDTHFDDYLSTEEGRKLPIVHCVHETSGWQIIEELLPYADTVVDKITFGSEDLPSLIADLAPEHEPIERIELCGLCTDICVISNAILLKTAFPNTPIVVDSTCCAGVSEQSHRTALDAMRAVQIEIV